MLGHAPEIAQPAPSTMPPTLVPAREAAMVAPRPSSMVMIDIVCALASSVSMFWVVCVPAPGCTLSARATR